MTAAAVTFVHCAPLGTPLPSKLLEPLDSDVWDLFLPPEPVRMALVVDGRLGANQLRTVVADIRLDLDAGADLRQLLVPNGKPDGYTLFSEPVILQRADLARYRAAEEAHPVSEVR